MLFKEDSKLATSITKRNNGTGYGGTPLTYTAKENEEQFELLKEGQCIYKCKEEAKPGVGGRV